MRLCNKGTALAGPIKPPEMIGALAPAGIDPNEIASFNEFFRSLFSRAAKSYKENTWPLGPEGWV